MSRDAVFLVEKAVSVPLVLAAVLLLSPAQLLTTFIVLGHGHFFIAYLYQYRAGKITARYGALYLLSLAAVLIAFLHSGRVDLLIVTSGLVFLVHFLQDEVMLAGKKPALQRTLEMLPILILYAGLILHRAMQVRLLPQAALVATAIVIAYVALLAIRRQRPDLLSSYFLSITGLLLSLVWLKQIPSLQVLLGALILLHYSSWYICYYFKVRESAERRRSYLLSVAGCNLLAVGLYATFAASGSRHWLGFLFLPAYFYVWTLMHTLFSVRWNDWKGLLR